MKESVGLAYTLEPMVMEQATCRAPEDRCRAVSSTVPGRASQVDPRRCLFVEAAMELAVRALKMISGAK